VVKNNIILRRVFLGLTGNVPRVAMFEKHTRGANVVNLLFDEVGYT